MESEETDMQNRAGNKVISIDGLLTAEEAAKLLTVSPRTLWGLTKSGALPAIKIGRSVRYARADIDAFIASRRTTKAEG